MYFCENVQKPFCISVCIICFTVFFLFSEPSFQTALLFYLLLPCACTLSSSCNAITEYLAALTLEIVANK